MKAHANSVLHYHSQLSYFAPPPQCDRLNVRMNSEDTRDFTNTSLPAVTYLSESICLLPLLPSFFFLQASIPCCHINHLHIYIFLHVSPRVRCHTFLHSLSPSRPQLVQTLASATPLSPPALPLASMHILPALASPLDIVGQRLVWALLHLQEVPRPW